MNIPARVAVFASGGGTNLQALLERFNGPAAARARVALVVASRPGIGALERAERAGVPTVVVGAGRRDPAVLAPLLLAELDSHRIDIVVLAGYLQLVPLEVVERYRERMLNIHPALLPAFGGRGMYGLNVHRAVLTSGARLSGATVHLVGERYDEGPILAQWPVPVLAGDTPEALAERVLRVEHLLLPAAVELVAGGGDRAAVLSDPVSFELAGAGVPAETSVRALLGLPRGSPHAGPAG